MFRELLFESLSLKILYLHSYCESPHLQAEKAHKEEVSYKLEKYIGVLDKDHRRKRDKVRERDSSFFHSYALLILSQMKRKSSNIFAKVSISS